MNLLLLIVNWFLILTIVVPIVVLALTFWYWFLCKIIIPDMVRVFRRKFSRKK